MTLRHFSTFRFIQSVLNVTKTFQLDGFDVDWEFPAWLGADDREKIHFVQLLQELRKEFDRSGQKLILTIAVAAPQAIIDQSYFVPEIAEYVLEVEIAGCKMLQTIVTNCWFFQTHRLYKPNVVRLSFLCLVFPGDGFECPFIPPLYRNGLFVHFKREFLCSILDSEGNATGKDRHWHTKLRSLL